MTDKPIALEEREAEHGKLFSPSAARNSPAIAEKLRTRLPRGARVLEIASGTGEHGEAACALRPDLLWQYSDPDPVSRASQAARAAERNGLLAPLGLDTSTDGWWAHPVLAAKGSDALYCANMIHIAPWSAALGLARGAAELLAPGGKLWLYGPFLDGKKSAPSNLDFDRSLKSRDPRWGVRAFAEVEAAFAEAGLDLAEREDMPANNWLAGFSRR